MLSAFDNSKPSNSINSRTATQNNDLQPNKDYNEYVNTINKSKIQSENLVPQKTLNVEENKQNFIQNNENQHSEITFAKAKNFWKNLWKKFLE